MTDYETGGALEIDVSEFVGGMEEAGDASGTFASETEDTSESLLDLDAAGIAAGASVAAVGGAAQSALDETQPLRESLGRTSVSMGQTQEETEELATSLSDATFPLEDVSQTMDTLARIGVDTEEEMEALALASDNVADATGESANAIADNLGPAVQGLDGDISNLEDNQDALTTALRETTLDSGELGRVLERNSQELQEMGLESDEAALLISQFSEETGATGRELRREFQTAIGDAEGDLDEFQASTGVSADEARGLAQELEGSTSRTDEFAGAANESLTTMDTLRASFADVRMSAAGLLGPIDALGPALMALGGVAMTASTVSLPALGSAAAAAGGALGGVGAVISGPVLLAIAALVAAIAGLVVAWREDFLGIQTVTMEVLGAVRESVEESLLRIREFWETTGQDLLESTIETFVSIATTVEEVLLLLSEEIVQPFLERLFEVWQTHGEDIFNDTLEIWQSVSELISSVLTFLWEEVISPTLDIINEAWDEHGELITAIIHEAWEIIETVVIQQLDAVLTAINATLSVLNGDWEDAWEEIEAFADRTLERIVSLVTDWPIVGTIADRLDDVIREFSNLARDLVGNSIVPNMLDDIVREVLSWDIVEQFAGQLAGVRDQFESLAQDVVGNSIIPGMLDASSQTIANAPLGDAAGVAADGVRQEFGEMGEDVVDTTRSALDDAAGEIADFDADIDTDFDVDSPSDSDDDDQIRDPEPDDWGDLHWNEIRGTRDVIDEFGDLVEEGQIDPDDHEFVHPDFVGDDARGFTSEVEEFVRNNVDVTADQVLEGLDAELDDFVLEEDFPRLSFEWFNRHDDIDDPAEHDWDRHARMAHGVDGEDLPFIQDGEFIPELAGLATGGWVGSDGLAMLHANEQVLPESQVSERGEASFDPDSISDGFDGSSAADEMIRLLRDLRDAVRDDGTMRIREKDIVRSLEQIFDRHGASI